jgi:hypothetical protein
MMSVGLQIKGTERLLEVFLKGRPRFLSIGEGIVSELVIPNFRKELPSPLAHFIESGEDFGVVAIDGSVHGEVGRNGKEPAGGILGIAREVIGQSGLKFDRAWGIDRLLHLDIVRGERGRGGGTKGGRVAGIGTAGRRGDSGCDVADMGSSGSGLDSESEGIRIRREEKLMGGRVLC